MSRTRSILRSCATLLLLGIFAVSAPTGSVAQTRPSTERVNGAYRVVFAGHLTGRGTATVNPRQVIINAPQIGDEQGRNGNLRARCIRTSNHFTGTGTAPGGGTVTIKGRLDPSNKSLRASRLSFTYILSTGEAGRAVGDRNGGNP